MRPKLRSQTVFCFSSTTPVPAGAASVDASIIATKDANVSIESSAAKVWSDIPDTQYAEVSIVLRNRNNGAASTIAPDGVVYVWAEESGKTESYQLFDHLIN